MSFRELSSTDSESEEKAVSPPKKEEIEVEQNSNLNESFESDVDIQSEEEAVFEKFVWFNLISLISLLVGLMLTKQLKNIRGRSWENSALWKRNSFRKYFNFNILSVYSDQRHLGQKIRLHSMLKFNHVQETESTILKA